MLRRLTLRDFVIVPALELDLRAGFTALTGETGAGKSILIDALQLVLGQRGDAGVVREGAERAEIAAEFDADPGLSGWLAEAGFGTEDEALLLRRSLDAQGRSRAWVNGSAATLTQLRELGERLLDIHGQHAWQSLTRPDAVRALLDGYAQADPAPHAAAWAAWRAAQQRLDDARGQQHGLEAERERLAWQLGEIDRLAPAAGEWAELEAEHRRLSHAQALLDAMQAALQSIDDDHAAATRTAQAIAALDEVVAHDPALQAPLDVLRAAEAQLQDAAHTLNTMLRRSELDPERLQGIDERLTAWVGLARRFRRAPDDLPVLHAQWRDELAQLDAATDLAALEREAAAARKACEATAAALSQHRRTAAPRLAADVSAAMQQLGMAGGRFEIALETLAEPQRHGSEAVEFRVAAHPGSTPRALAKVASGGELSRIALAVAVSTSRLGEAGTLIFDEIDAGVGGTVADAVGALMRRLGRDRQVLCVTHLPQVAACADQQCVVSKVTRQGRTASEVLPVSGPARVQELARMLGGSGGTSLAHAQALLDAAAAPMPPAAPPRAARKQRA